MTRIKDQYQIIYNGNSIGSYSVFDNGKAAYYTGWGCPWDIEKELKALGLEKNAEDVDAVPALEKLIQEENRVRERKQRIYEDGILRAERRPEESGERYTVYRRSAKEGDPDYSPLPHDAPHYEGSKTPEGMREWASWYAFNKMDDGTYEAELDEAWWWGGGHNDGGTIHTAIPEEWFELPYDKFLDELITLASAAHYGFTSKMLKEKKGLKEFFGFK